MSVFSFSILRIFKSYLSLHLENLMAVSSESETKEQFCSSRWAMLSRVFCMSPENGAFEISQLCGLADERASKSGYVSDLSFLYAPNIQLLLNGFRFPAASSLSSWDLRSSRILFSKAPLQFLWPCPLSLSLSETRMS